ncbi:hypothetical protein EGW08_000515, partial [Elysia chlorotica]
QILQLRGLAKNYWREHDLEFLRRQHLHSRLRRLQRGDSGQRFLQERLQPRRHPLLSGEHPDVHAVQYQGLPRHHQDRQESTHRSDQRQIHHALSGRVPCNQPAVVLCVTDKHTACRDRSLMLTLTR